ncbi:hypothetical protein B7494_g7139 [Chlorociboria aeruginascens]|nr:hypothetical protein B7494_g7139 [Chlorociboria aeruginascens]
MEPKIFNHPRPKRPLIPTPSKKRKIIHKIEEISFDNAARADYLTGFHKRKVARAKTAQEEAVKKAREEKIGIRKQLREERRQELAEHVEAVNALLRDVDPVADSSEGDEWDGIQEDPVVELVDHEEEYVDEDRYTTVTIEAVDVSKEGLRSLKEDSEKDEEKSEIVEEKDGKDTKKAWPKKPRKKKFKYETKAERKVTRGKQKAGNKSRADARRGND